MQVRRQVLKPRQRQLRWGGGGGGRDKGWGMVGGLDYSGTDNTIYCMRIYLGLCISVLRACCAS